MTTPTLRSTLKSVLPGFIRTPVVRTEPYLRRLRNWMQVVRYVRGVSFADRRAVWSAFFAAPVTSFFGLDRWRDPMLARDATVEVAGIGRFRVRAKCDDLWHVLPSRERAVLEAIRTRLKPGDTFVDAGANIGFYTIIASKLDAPTGQVKAIEMMPDTAAVLRENIRINGATNVIVVEKALSDVAGQSVTATVAEGKYGRASISTAFAAEGKREVTVLTTTLSDILAGVKHVRLMKMDIEGVEEMALRGAGEALEHIDDIVFEVSGGESKVGSIWGDMGFTLSSLDGRNCIASRQV